MLRQEDGCGGPFVVALAELPSFNTLKSARVLDDPLQIQLKSTRFYRNYQFLEGYEPQCLKIAQNVAFDIASEACYVYILIGQKFIKNAKNNEQLGEFLKTGQIVLPDSSILIGQKLAENANSSRQKS